MMNDKTKRIGFIKAILKNEYPAFMSKDFSSRVMDKVNKPIHGYNISTMACV